MRLVIISDTHMSHEELVLPEGDVLIHCGDFSSHGRVNELIGFVRWLSNVAPKYGATFVIAGNHDRQLEIDPSLADVFGGVAEYLFNSGAEYKGKNFWGSPFTPAYNNWAFNLPRDGEELRKNWAQVPSNCDVLITHGPPYRILDGVSRQDHAGCRWLRERIEEVKPKLAIWGHIHESRGLNYWSIPGTTCINASNLDGRYELVHKPIVLDIDEIVKVIDH